LTAIAVTIACRNVGTATFIDFAGSIAHTAGIQCTHTIVHIVADAIAVRICCAGSATNTNRIQLATVAIAITGRDVRAAAFVDGTGTIADATFIGVSAFFGCSLTGILDGKRHFGSITTVREILHIQRSSEGAIRGQLCKQDPVISIGEAIGVTVEDVPDAAYNIVDDDVPTSSPTAWIKGCNPILVRGGDQARSGFSSRSICRFGQTNRDVAVVDQLRETGKQQRVLGLCRGTSQRMMIEARRGGQRQGRRLIAEYRGNEIGRPLSLEVNAVGGHARQVTGGVFHDRLHEETWGIKNPAGGGRVVIAGSGVGTVLGRGETGTTESKSDRTN